MAERGDKVWEFCTANFAVTLEVKPEYEPYDGDDEDGEIQAKIDSGEYEWFSANVCVYLRADAAFSSERVFIASDSLGMCCYESFEGFYTSHRKHKEVDYFTGMVREAIRSARRAVAAMPKLRAA